MLGTHADGARDERVFGAESGKTGQICAKVGEIGTKSQEICGNRGFGVDFARFKVAL
jgi:hypothetical protein